MGNRVGNRVGNRWGTAGEPLGNRLSGCFMHGAVASSRAGWPDGKHFGSRCVFSKSIDAPERVTDCFDDRLDGLKRCFDDSLHNRFDSVHFGSAVEEALFDFV